MKRIGILIMLVVVLLLGVAFFTGIIPGFQLFDNGTSTISNSYADLQGNKYLELLDSKGYIISYKNDGFSEKIIVTGQLTALGAFCSCNNMISKGMFRVYLKENSYSAYELISAPSGTSMYISNPNPGKFVLDSNNVGCDANDGILSPYQFNIVGNKYANGAIKVEFWVYMDAGVWDYEGYKWYLMSSDEAYLYSGYGELILPTGITEGGMELPYTTFEIGQTVKIGVGTAKGGYTSGSDPWRVTLNEPYGGSISDPDDGGGVILEEYFPNDCDSSNTFFEFIVTEQMAQKSMSSQYPYTVRIWNTLLPKGTLQVDFVDFLYKCPGLVEFGGDSKKIKVDEYATVTLTADVNSETQSDIDYFRVSVVYGTDDTLLPSEATSERWIIHTTNVGVADKQACNIPQSISFKPAKESYVTVFAKAFDTQGRCSVATSTRQIWAWDEVSDGGSGEPPDDAIDYGDDYYGGGHTDPWLPWDPEGGNWEEQTLIIDSMLIVKILASICIIAIAGVIAFFHPISKSNPMYKAIIMIAGLIVVILIWYLF